jgi:amino acid transporter
MMESATEAAVPREAPSDGPRFGLATATFVVVSSMIGTGVLTTSGFTVYFVGSNQLMLALWAVGGVLALCGALTLCELSAALPRSGGDYVFLLTGPRVAYAMARAGQFPEVAGRLSARGAPAIATAMQVAWSLVLVWTASFERILLYSGVGLAIFSMLTVAAVFVLRWRSPDLARPFRTPGYPLVPAIYLVGTGLLIAAVFYERPVVSSISLLSIAAGVPVYYLWTSGALRGRPAP